MILEPSPTAYNRWISLMRQGDFEAAWRVSDELLRRVPPPQTQDLPLHMRRLWNGELLDGKDVLVRCDHGLGDTIQFARYLPMVKAVASSLHVAAQSSLLELLGSTDCIDTLFDREKPHNTRFDVAVEVMELPHVFRTTIPTIPLNVPYLHVKPYRTERISHRSRIGLVWKAGDWDERRSIPFTCLRPLFEGIDADFQILQYEPEAAGWLKGFGRKVPFSTIAELGAVMQELDLVISVDTMAAHLAGALGVRTWVLLYFQPDWRWMCDTDLSPWYPTMRLFRQKSAGEWPSVISKVRDALTQHRQGVLPNRGRPHQAYRLVIRAQKSENSRGSRGGLV